MDIKEKLLAVGGRIWDKKGHRIYLSRIIGKFADIDYYKTGNLHRFAINGERWSNCQGYKLLAAVERAYYDCDADRFIGLGDYEGTVVTAIENTEIVEAY